MTEQTREHFEDHIDVVVADSFTVTFCEHGYGQIGFWIEGEKQPFAVAYFSPADTPEIARVFIDAIKPAGNA